VVVLACAAVVLMAAQCDDKVWTLGVFTAPQAGNPVTVPVPVPVTPPPSGPWGGSQIVLPVDIANGLPPGATVTVSASPIDNTLNSTTHFDIAAGGAIEVDIKPDGTLVSPPGISIRLPVNADALVAQGFASNRESITREIIENSVFVSRQIDVGLGTQEVLRPSLGSATIGPPMTLRLDGVTGTFNKTRFQCFIDIPPRQNFDADPAKLGYQLPAARWFDDYALVQLTALGGVGTAARALSAGMPVPAPLLWTVKPGTTLPLGMTLSPFGELSGTPQTLTPMEGESALLHVVATDVAGRASERTYELVLNPVLAGVVTTLGLPQATSHSHYSYTLLVGGPGGTNPADYNWSVTYPAFGFQGSGLSLNTETGVVSGIPNANFAGNSKLVFFNVQLTHKQSLIVGPLLPLKIEIRKPLSLPLMTLQDADFGVPYSGSIAATGGLVPYTYTLTTGSMPFGLQLNSVTGAITGTPVAGENNPFSVTVTDSSAPPLTQTRTYTIAATTMPSATVGQPYQFQFAVNGPAGPDPTNYTFTTTGLSTAGLEVSSNGLVTGIPSSFVGAERVVSFSLTVRVTATNELLPTRLERMTVYQPVVIPTEVLPSASAFEDYFVELGATGGKGKLSYSVSLGQLPSGLTLNSEYGVITGRPDREEPQTFTLMVADADIPARSASRTYMLSFNAVSFVGFENVGGTGVVDLTLYMHDTDGTPSSTYALDFSYRVVPSVEWRQVRLSSLETVGFNLSAVPLGGPFTLRWDTGMTELGERIGHPFLQPLVLRIRSRDNTENNIGGGARYMVIDNTEAVVPPNLTPLPPAADDPLINPAATVLTAGLAATVTQGIVTVPIHFKPGENHSVAGLRFGLQYQTSRLQYISTAIGPAASNASKSVSALLVGGSAGSTVALTEVYGDATLISSGIVAYVTFRYLGSSATPATVDIINVTALTPQNTLQFPVVGIAGGVFIP